MNANVFLKDYHFATISVSGMTLMAGVPESEDCGQDEEPVGVEPRRPSPEQVASEAPLRGLQDL